MDQTAIFAPFFAMFLLTFLVWVYMYVRRIHFITTRRLSGRELQQPGALVAAVPMSVTSPADNLRNLFEIPVIFYAFVLYLFAVRQVDAVYIAGAWIFVAFRGLHSTMHCTLNIVMVRFVLYVIATLTLWLMILRAAVRYLGS
jgi:hypothetical protein